VFGATFLKRPVPFSLPPLYAAGTGPDAGEAIPTVSYSRQIGATLVALLLLIFGE
jgi:hypothetical protein